MNVDLFIHLDGVIPGVPSEAIRLDTLEGSASQPFSQIDEGCGELHTLGADRAGLVVHGRIVVRAPRRWKPAVTSRRAA